MSSNLAGQPECRFQSRPVMSLRFVSSGASVKLLPGLLWGLERQRTSCEGNFARFEFAPSHVNGADFVARQRHGRCRGTGDRREHSLRVVVRMIQPVERERETRSNSARSLSPSRIYSRDCSPSKVSSHNNASISLKGRSPTWAQRTKPSRSTMNVPCRGSPSSLSAPVSGFQTP